MRTRYLLPPDNLMRTPSPSTLTFTKGRNEDDRHSLSEHWPDPILISFKFERELWSEHWPDRAQYVTNHSCSIVITNHGSITVYTLNHFTESSLVSHTPLAADTESIHRITDSSLVSHTPLATDSELLHLRFISRIPYPIRNSSLLSKSEITYSSFEINIMGPGHQIPGPIIN
eukprot:sb/3472094/